MVYLVKVGFFIDALNAKEAQRKVLKYLKPIPKRKPIDELEILEPLTQWGGVK
jgi:hypothetical protein